MQKFGYVVAALVSLSMFVGGVYLGVMNDTSKIPLQDRSKIATFILDEEFAKGGVDLLNTIEEEENPKEQESLFDVLRSWIVTAETLSIVEGIDKEVEKAQVLLTNEVGPKTLPPKKTMFRVVKKGRHWVSEVIH